MSRYRPFSLLLLAVQVLGYPLPARAFTDTAFDNLSLSGLGWAMLALLLMGVVIPILMSWATYRVLQWRQPDYQAPLLPIVAASFVTYSLCNQFISSLVNGGWGLLFGTGFIVGATVLAWNFTRKPLPQWLLPSLVGSVPAKTLVLTIGTLFLNQNRKAY